IPMRNETYVKAVDTLRYQYDDPEALRVSLYDKLSKLSIHSNHVSQLRDGVQSLQQIIRQLEAAGDPVNSQPYLLQQIIDKIPTFTMLEVQRSKPPEGWTLDLLFDALWSYIKPRELIVRKKQDTPRFPAPYQQAANRSFNPQRFQQPRLQQPRRGQNNNFQFRPPTSTGNFSAPNYNTFPTRGGYNNFSRPQVPASGDFRSNRQPSFQNPPSPVPPCYFCQGAHYNVECSKYKTVEARKTRLGQLQRCLYCLKKGHPSASCPSEKRPCTYCHKDNHTRVLCHQLLNTFFKSSFNQTRPNNNSGRSNQGSNVGVHFVQNEQSQPLQDPNQPVQHPPQTPSVPSDVNAYFCSTETLNSGSTTTVKCFRQDCQSCTNRTKLDNSTMLLTASAHIQHPITKALHPVRLFLDCGSQESYIHSPIVQTLALPKTLEHMLVVHTFNKEEPQHLLSHFVSIDLVCN
ncbi:MAG: DUF1759 domain-containing protein, partial [Gammaproteobacteria bacterium]|nr:DUF1759 domain-containing protein [Gammaproteobacteria bacterium]